MRKVFWDDPYQQTLTTRVASVRDAQIICEETTTVSNREIRLR